MSTSNQYNIYTFNDFFNALNNPNKYLLTDVGVVKKIINNVNSKKSNVIEETSNFIMQKFADATIKFVTTIFTTIALTMYTSHISGSLLRLFKLKKIRTPLL